MSMLRSVWKNHQDAMLKIWSRYFERFGVSFGQMVLFGLILEILTWVVAIIVATTLHYQPNKHRAEVPPVNAPNTLRTYAPYQFGVPGADGPTER